ncbi:unnamed protein product [Danaus chrysippus]|uniref:(African queen) hypothetical protein n=1 Tax=Danaus chrysippus TaxID=151541 RepID=A0A8J2MAE5_9NEOP|nr:unnamed protein product [Danaus chrysippus]
MLNWFSMANMDNDEVLEFSSLIEQAAQLYQVGQYSESFQEHVFSDVLANFVGSSNGVYSLVGCRLMVRFLDRHCNAAYLSMPAIYYEFSQTPLKVAEYNGNDKAFLRHYREQIHDYSIKVVQYHSYSQINLRTMFSLIACTILEVPCSLTAAAASCLMMTIQDFALTQEKIPDRSRFWLHAIVLSIMSLICWVHKAPDLYRYVNEIISRRAKDAPQLNPPLLKTYNLQSQHAYWKKSTLFFEDWELRYGLWKHFQAARLLFCLAVFLAVLFTDCEGRTKKVVIHVPYKVKKIKHVHTVYKTIHHHHTHHDHEHGLVPDDHEHFHHMHLLEEPSPTHVQAIPEFLPDGPLDLPLDISEMPRDIPLKSIRHGIPLYRQK